MSIQKRIDKRKCKRFKYFGLQPNEDSCKLGAETLDKSKWCVVCIEKHEAVKIQDISHKTLENIKKLRKKKQDYMPKSVKDEKINIAEISVFIKCEELVKKQCGCEKCK